MIPLPDNASVLLSQRRLLYNGAFDQSGNILQRIHVLIKFCEKRCFKILQDLPDMGKHFKRGSKGNQISWIGRLIADAADQSFQIVNRI